MVRKSLEEIEQVSATDVLEILHQENSQLRMQVLVQKIVIDRLKELVASISEGKIED